MLSKLAVFVSLTIFLAGTHAQENTTESRDSIAAKTIRTIEAKADDIALSPDGTLLFASYSKRKNGERLAPGMIKMWRLNATASAPAWQWRCAGYTANQLAVAPNGKTLAVACTDGKTRLWSLPRGKFLRAIGAVEDSNNGGRRGALGVTFSADGFLLAISNSTHKRSKKEENVWTVGSTIRILDARSLKVRNVLRAAGAARALQISPDKTRLAISHDTSYYIQVFGKDAWGATAELTVLEMQTGKTVYSSGPVSEDASATGTLRFSPDGRTLFAGWGSPNVLLVRLDSSTETDLTRAFHDLNLQPHPGYPDYGTVPATMSPDGLFVAGARNSAPDSEAVVLFKAGSRERPVALSAASRVVFVAFTPDSQSLFGVDEKGAVLLWKLT